MMVTDWINDKAVELLGADTPGVIADALQEAYEMGRTEMLRDVHDYILAVAEGRQDQFLAYFADNISCAFA